MLEAKNNGKSVREVIQLNTCDVTVRDFAPLSDWGGMNEPTHFVQFYETDTFLLDSLNGFIGAGLRDGD